MADLSKASLLNREFDSIRNQLVDLLKVYYPEQYQDFNSASIGSSLIDLLAHVSNILSYNTDKKFNELFLDSVTERNSVLRLAKTLGYKAVGNRSAISLADISLQVPVTATGPDTSYLPVYRTGVQLKGAGQAFETINDIDFSSDFSEDGTANRKIVPNINANQDIINYTITKREVIKAGATVLFKREISTADASTPFFEISLPENNILEILSIIAKPGLNQTNNPTFDEFSDPNLRFYEVDELAESKIFVNDDTVPSVNGIKAGKFLTVQQRFIKEFLSDGSCKITFGGGTPDNDGYQAYLSKLQFGEEDTVKIKDTFDNMALGSKLPGTSTLWIKYRIGGGPNSNVGSNVLNQVANINAVIMGADTQKNQTVINSTTATNVLPAIGGAGLPTVDEIKNSIAGNFSSQKRCITLDDYLARVAQLPGKFGAPFRSFGKIEDNKVKLYILTLDANGKILTTSTSTVKNNIVEYLTGFRSLNDFVEINDGKVINLQIEADVLIDKTFNANEVKVSGLNALKDFFDINKQQMNQHLYVANIVKILEETKGILNVANLRLFNMEGGNYSSTLSSQATGERTFVSASTFRSELELINNTLFSTPISIFEIRFPEQDLRLRVI